MSTFTFKWPSGPQEVIVTGEFDDWKKSLPLVKQADGSFELTVPLKGDSVLYKYVVDGEWLVNAKEKIRTDDNGIDNNVVDSEDLKASSTATQIPEAGGLPVSKEGVSTTVMPTAEGKQATLGEPGIFVPQSKEALSAFNNVEERDAKALNAEIDAEEAREMTPEEKKKQKKKLKKLQYRARKKTQKREAAAAAADESTSEATTPASGTPAPDHVVVVPVSETGVNNDAPADLKEAEAADQDSALEAEKKGTLDPFVVGAIGGFGAGAAAGAAAQAQADASEISKLETAEPSIKPAIQEPIEPQAEGEPKVFTEEPKIDHEEVTKVDPVALAAVTGPSGEDNSKVFQEEAKIDHEEVTKVDPVALASVTKQPEPSAPVVAKEVDATPVPTAPVAAKEVDASPVPKGVVAKEVNASPVEEAFSKKDDIIMTQGGTDAKEVEEVIEAATGGKVAVEEINVSPSEAELLQANAEPTETIPTPEPVAEAAKRAKAPTKESKTAKDKKEKEKKKGGFMTKLKKMFK